jgi:hypothetical protein
LLVGAGCAHQQGSAVAFVENVYRQHDPASPAEPPWMGAGCRATFSARLCDLLERDRREAGDEVPRLNGDPLYDAQDMDIKDLRVAAAGPERVAVTFHNLGTSASLLLTLVREGGGWRIDDISYRHEQPPTTLTGILQAPR